MEETSKEDVEGLMHIKRELAEAKRISLTPNVARVLTNEQRKLYAGKLADLGNIVAGALVFGQFVSESGFHAKTFLLGFISFFALYFWSHIMYPSTDEEQKLWKI